MFCESSLVLFTLEFKKPSKLKGGKPFLILIYKQGLTSSDPILAIQHNSMCKANSCFF